MNAVLRPTLCAVVFLSCAPLAPALRASQPEVLAAWSQILGRTSAPAAHLAAPPEVDLRFVVPDGVMCDSFRVKTRSAPGGSWTVAASSPATRSKSAAQLQEIDVCSYSAGGWYEAALEWQDGSGQWQQAVLTSECPEGSTRAEVAKKMMKPGLSNGADVVVKGPLWIGGARVPNTPRAELVMATLGDSGCRGMPEGATSSRKIQSCDPVSWPLADIAEKAAAEKPDLVVHVGDYRYFLEDTVSQDSWLYWQRDFFPAAQPLLLAAPWSTTSAWTRWRRGTSTSPRLVAAVPRRIAS